MKLSIVAVALLRQYVVARAQDVPQLTPTALSAALAANPTGVEADRLAERIRSSFGGSELLKRGVAPRIEELSNDLDNAAGSWPLANLSMAKSLAYARYDFRFEYGQGFHNNRHGRALLPDSLRWLWRDHR